MRLIKYIIPFLFIFSCCDDNAKEIRILQFNIWQEGTVIKGGFEAIIEEVIDKKADIIALSEVRNYEHTNLAKRLVIALKKKGYTYYSKKSYDTGVLSKYPIISQTALYPVTNDHGSITKAIIYVNGTEIAFYSAHLDYLNCAYYAVRSYDGSNWNKLKEPLTDTTLLHIINLKSERDDAIKSFIEDAKIEIKNNRIVIIGGDFNEPSYLDWRENNKNNFDHHGVVINWDVTSLLNENGFIDSYRAIHKNPIIFPGFTYPSANKNISIKKLTWAPESDERERIDYIFHYPNPKLTLKDVFIVGPKECIAYSKVTRDEGKDKYLTPKTIWPTDHKALLSIYELENN